MRAGAGTRPYMYQTRKNHCNYVAFHLINIVRYWIWWNDLVQGPFEINELTALQAFSEELQVCMEGRVDWLPASRVADLAPAVEALRSHQNSTSFAPPLPPPPPPERPPTLEPLQGYFFAGSPDQKLLFDPPGENKGPFAFAPAGEEPETGLDAWPAQVTMPFRFGGRITVGGENVVRTLAAPVQPAPVDFKPLPRPLPVPVQEPLPEPEPALELFPERDSVDEPETVIVSEIEPPVVDIPEPPLPEIPKTEETPDVIELPRPVSPPSPIIRESPLPEEKLPPPSILPTKEELPLEILPAERPTALPIPEVVPEEPPKKFVLPRMSSWERAERPAPRSWKWLPWVLGASAMMALLVYGALTLMDYFTSRDAIITVKKMNLPEQPIPKVAAAPVVAAPLPVEKPVPVVPLVPKKTPPKAAVVKHASKPKPKAVSKPKVKSTPPPARVPEMNAMLLGVVVTEALKPAASAPVQSPVPAQKKIEKPVPDLYVNRQNDAISQVMKFRIAAGKITIGEQAKTLLETMHDKELLHAAEMGERLYLPDKLSWSALREGGPLYRVYLNYSALQANGDRVQTRSYQFTLDLQTGQVTTDDNATRQDFLSIIDVMTHDRQAMAKDIENILSGVDQLNKQKLRSMVVRNSRKNSTEIQSIESATKSANEKVRKTIIYFRTKYPEKALQNVAKAYSFGELLK
jgi:hypothetical protein